jgi:hypothetical protein
MMDVDELVGAFRDALGFPGKMLSGSKSGYLKANPHNNAFFNANILDESGNQVWFGDVDLTLEWDNLQKLSTDLGIRFFVTREMPYRFMDPKERILAMGKGGDSEYPSFFEFSPDTVS